MTLSITNESKNNLSVSNEDKDDSMTWDSSDPLTWDDDPGTWDSPRRHLAKPSKNTLTITNKPKV